MTRPSPRPTSAERGAFGRAHEVGVVVAGRDGTSQRERAVGVAENKAAVLELFETIRWARVPEFRALLAESPVWWIAAGPEQAARLPGVIAGDSAARGKDAVSKLLFESGFYRDRRSSPDHPPMEYERHHLIGEDDMVVSHHTMRTVTAAGVPYENDYIFVFRCEDGRIAEVWEHLGRQAPPLPKD
jgi:ketosteroid isomerase-like protein